MNKHTKIINNLLLSFLAFILTGFGTSLTIEAAIGISSFTALNVSLAQVFHIKIGTITAILNFIFLIMYIIITKGKYKIKYLLQFIGVSSIGLVINFFTYKIFDKIEFNNYIICVIFLLIGIILGGSSVGLILSLDTMSFPIEAFCLAFAEKYNKEFSKIRRLIDIISITLSIFISIIFSYPFLIREGTIISMILFATIIGYSHNYFNKSKIIQNLKIFI